METLHITNPTRNMPEISRGDRLALTLAGILIAIICSLVFLHDTHLMERAAVRLPEFGEHSKIVPTTLSVEIKKFEVASATSTFR